MLPQQKVLAAIRFGEGPSSCAGDLRRAAFDGSFEGGLDRFGSEVEPEVLQNNVFEVLRFLAIRGRARLSESTHGDRR